MNVHSVLGGDLILSKRDKRSEAVQAAFEVLAEHGLRGVPVAVNNGAGTSAQNGMGTGVIRGMLAAIFLAVFYIPLCFAVIRKIFPAAKVVE